MTVTLEKQPSKYRYVPGTNFFYILRHESPIKCNRLTITEEMYQVMWRNEGVAMLQSACLLWDAFEHTGSKVVSPSSLTQELHTQQS